MEPENHPFEKENHLPSTSILMFKMSVFGLLYDQNQPEPAYLHISNIDQSSLQDNQRFTSPPWKPQTADTDPSSKGYVWIPAAVVVAWKQTLVLKDIKEHVLIHGMVECF